MKHHISGEVRGGQRRIDGRFDDRQDAGRQLAAQLEEYAGRDDVVVLGLPRGGVPVAAEVANALGVALDIMVVRKLGTPGHAELAMGAIASGGAQVVNPRIMEQGGISDAQLQEEIERQKVELQRRERTYRGDHPFPELEGRTVLLVDDGLATGATMRAAVQALRQHEPHEAVVAVPVAPQHIQDNVLREADRFVALLQPEPFYAVGQWYRNFNQTDDAEVTELLAAARSAVQ